MNSRRTWRGRLRGLPSRAQRGSARGPRGLRGALPDPARALGAQTGPDFKVPRFSKESDRKRRVEAPPTPALRAPRPYLTRNARLEPPPVPPRCHSNASPSTGVRASSVQRLGPAGRKHKPDFFRFLPPRHTLSGTRASRGAWGPRRLQWGQPREEGPGPPRGGGVDGRRLRLHQLSSGRQEASSPRVDLSGRAGRWRTWGRGCTRRGRLRRARAGRSPVRGAVARFGL